MIRITYLSEESTPWTPRMLLDLLRQCHLNNPDLGLTGLLVHGNGAFLQTIEGDDDAVDTLVAKIARDPRHKNFRILRREVIQRRLYGGWSMGFQRLSEEMLKDVPELENFVLDDFNPEYLSENPVAVESLLQKHRSQHWDPLLRELDARDNFIIELRNALAGARQRNEMAGLLIESVIESASNGGLDPAHVELCRAILASLRSPLAPDLAGLTDAL
jgi:hypothetical protein